jgi:hypothetical protein
MINSQHALEGLPAACAARPVDAQDGLSDFRAREPAQMIAAAICLSLVYEDDVEKSA